MEGQLHLPHRITLLVLYRHQLLGEVLVWRGGIARHILILNIIVLHYAVCYLSSHVLLILVL